MPKPVIAAVPDGGSAMHGPDVVEGRTAFIEGRAPNLNRPQ
jgi:hypothetical protein